MPKPAFKRIGITARSEIADKEALLLRLVQVMEKAGAEIFLDARHCIVPSLQEYKRLDSFKDLDLIVILGGDGTTLRTVRELKDTRIPLLTVNRGTVGFLASLDTSEIESALPSLIQGLGSIEERQVLRCSVFREGKELLQGIALNEVVVSQGAIARIIELKVSVGNEPLTVFRADGLIIATPTGSTAYSLSAGGPIVHPQIAGIILTPINAHTLSQKPLVIPATESIAIDVLPRESKFESIEVSLTFDGQVHHPLQGKDRVTVTELPERIRLLRKKRDIFYETLREKLKWGE